MENERCACCRDELGKKPVFKYGHWFRDDEHALRYLEEHRPKPRPRARTADLVVHRVLTVLTMIGSGARSLRYRRTH